MQLLGKYVEVHRADLGDRWRQYIGIDLIEIQLNVTDLLTLLGD